ncbi:unnamed protein product, partial [marine sediment metagenome]
WSTSDFFFLGENQKNSQDLFYMPLMYEQNSSFPFVNTK